MSIAGISQGVLDAVQAQRAQQAQDQQMAYQQFVMDQSRAAAQRAQQVNEASGMAMQGAFRPPPAMPGTPQGGPMPPPPGQASAPPQQNQPMPPQGGPTPPPAMPMGANGTPMMAGGGQGIPPYQTVNSSARPPLPQPSQSAGTPPPLSQRPEPTTPTEIASAGMLQQAVKNLKSNNVPPDLWADALRPLMPFMQESDKAQFAAMNGEIRAQAAAMKAYEDAKKLEQQGQEKTVQVLVGPNQYKTMGFNPTTGKYDIDMGAGSKVGGAGGHGASAGNMNRLREDEMRDMKPIDEAQRQSEELRGLIATGNPASTPQIQRLMTNYMNAGRITNQLYSANKGFGNLYERTTNALNKFISGKYSAEDKKMLLSLVNEMDKSVFDPSRKHVIDYYKKQAKLEGVDESIAERPNSFASDTAPATESWSDADEKRLNELEAKHGSK